jgi:hypothetical protein
VSEEQPPLADVVADGFYVDPFEDDAPLEADPACDLENPEACESCQ